MTDCSNNLASPGVKARSKLGRSEPNAKKLNGISAQNGRHTSPSALKKSASKSSRTQVKKTKSTRKEKVTKFRLKVNNSKQSCTVAKDDHKVKNRENDRGFEDAFNAGSVDNVTHECSNTNNGKQWKRGRLSSCDELKGLFPKHSSKTTSTEIDPYSLDVVSDDLGRGCENVEESFEERPSSESPSRSDLTQTDSATDFERFVIMNQDAVADFSDWETKESESTCRLEVGQAGSLTDFERFALENQDIDFTDECFPAQIGEKCNLCVDNVSKVSTSSSRMKLRLESSLKLKILENNSNNNNGDLSNGNDTQMNNNKISSLLSNLSSPGSSSSKFHNGIVTEETQTRYMTRRRKRRLSSLPDELDSDSQEPISKSRRTNHCDENSVISSSSGKGRGKNSSRDEIYSESSMCDVQNEASAENEDIASAWRSLASTEIEDKAENGNDEPSSTQTQVSAEQINIPDWMYVAVDCEMVGAGPKGRESILGRCSIVDYRGNVVYDKFVCPEVPITDYRTKWSGIRPSHLRGATPIADAFMEIEEILSNKIIIGHSVYNDFRALKMNPPFYSVRDTAQCKLLIQLAGLQGQGNSLKKLSAALLDRKIQVGRSGHCSVEDARATLDLFKLVRQDYEAELYLKWSKKSNTQILNDLAVFVEKAHATRGLRMSADSTEDSHFLNDEYWPSDVTDYG